MSLLLSDVRINVDSSINNVRHLLNNEILRNIISSLDDIKNLENEIRSRTEASISDINKANEQYRQQLESKFIKALNDIKLAHENLLKIIKEPLDI